MLAAVDGRIENVIVGLLLVAIIAGVVYFAGKLAGRPDIGGPGAAFIMVIGAILVLLDTL